MKSCETCKHDLGGDVCRYGYELECADDDYQLWEPDATITVKPIADEIEELYRDQQARSSRIRSRLRGRDSRVWSIWAMCQKSTARKSSLWM